MKNLIATTAITAALTLPAFAQSNDQPMTPEEIEELLAMSNSSAAERIVSDTGEEGDGNPLLAEMKFALGEMSAAERKTFFEADMQTRMELIEAKKKLRDNDSPAETDG